MADNHREVLATLVTAVEVHCRAPYSIPSQHAGLRNIVGVARSILDADAGLTRQQQAVLAHMARTGDSATKTGQAMGISTQTVKNHLSGVYRTLHVHNLTGAYVALGWLAIPEEAPMVDA